ncbi:MAG: Uma2 family endonuclease [Acidimicrobiales bacterium]
MLLGRSLDLEDLSATPDDGNRYEVLDGALVMTPPPGTDHQLAVIRLAVILDQATRPLGLQTFTAPLAWRIGPGQVPEPDLLVVGREAITKRAIEAPPLLVVEVLSPSGRPRDTSEKRRIYAEGGAAWYWLVDTDEPSLTVLRLAGDHYEDEARAVGPAGYVTDEPFPVRVVPAELVGPGLQPRY